MLVKGILTSKIPVILLLRAFCAGRIDFSGVVSAAFFLVFQEVISGGDFLETGFSLLVVRDADPDGVFVRVS